MKLNEKTKSQKWTKRRKVENTSRQKDEKTKVEKIKSGKDKKSITVFIKDFKKKIIALPRNPRYQFSKKSGVSFEELLGMLRKCFLVVL